MDEITPDAGLIADLEPQFQILLADWHAVEPSHPAGIAAEDRLQAMRAEVLELVRLGQWASGPADLLTVLGRHRDELMHSRLLAWLLDPGNRHGLGHAYLTQWLGTLWPDAGLGTDGLVEIDTEVTASGISGATGERMGSIADLVVRGDGWLVVVENKVGAGEQPRQCERLYWSWLGEAPDTRWVFLTPSGITPTSIESPEAKAAWTPMSYRQVRDSLSAVIPVQHNHSGVGLATAQQYLATLNAHTTFTGRSA